MVNAPIIRDVLSHHKVIRIWCGAKKDGHAGKPVHSKIFGWVQEVSWNWKQLIIYHPWSRNNCLPKLLGWFGWFQFALTWTSHLKLTSHVLFTFEPGSHMTYQGDGGALNPLRHQTKKLLKTKISYFISLHYTLDGGCVLTSYVEQIFCLHCRV